MTKIPAEQEAGKENHISDGNTRDVKKVLCIRSKTSNMGIIRTQCFFFLVVLFLLPGM